MLGGNYSHGQWVAGQAIISQIDILSIDVEREFMLDAEEPNFLPRYYFHVKVGQMTVLDRDGLALPSLEDAKNEAIRRAQELISQGVANVQGRAIVIARLQGCTLSYRRN